MKLNQSSTIVLGMSMFGFVTNPIVLVRFDGEDAREKKIVKLSGQTVPVQMLVYSGNETVSGSVQVTVPQGKKIEHLGIKVEMIGQVDLLYDRGNFVKFTSLVRELEGQGIAFSGTKSYPFEFSPEKPYETYSGVNVRLRYFIRVTMSRAYNNHYIYEHDFAVHNAVTAVAPAPVVPASTDADGNIVPASAPPEEPSIKMEVGIEDCLHIEFEFNKAKYHLKDVVLGKIFFLLVRIKIKMMELAVIRREITGSGSNMYTESENVVKYELMDGAPVKGECVPIRLFLANLADLTPTYRGVNQIFSVRYYLNLVLIDEEDRRYFKQQEIQFWRKAPDSPPTTGTTGATTTSV